MQQQISFIGQILSSHVEVIQTALLTEQISQNGPKTKNYTSQGSVATVRR